MCVGGGGSECENQVEDDLGNESLAPLSLDWSVWRLIQDQLGHAPLTVMNGSVRSTSTSPFPVTRQSHARPVHMDCPSTSNSFIQTTFLKPQSLNILTLLLRTAVDFLETGLTRMAASQHTRVCVCVSVCVCVCVCVCVSVSWRDETQSISVSIFSVGDVTQMTQEDLGEGGGRRRLFSANTLLYMNIRWRHTRAHTGGRGLSEYPILKRSSENLGFWHLAQAH